MHALTFKFFVLTLLGIVSFSSAANRYEAEDAIPADDHSDSVATDANASGGAFVAMREGNLLFTVTVAQAGFYTLYVNYSQPNDENGKIQNVTVNGTSVGQISFPYITTFTSIKGVSKLKLNAGENKIGIVKSWGWVNVDYIELTDYVETAFSITNALVTPNPSESAKKLYSFLYENFGKKVISGVMTNNVMLNDGNYTPCSLTNQTELAWIDSVSGKTPALIGFDFLHSTGLNSDQQWHQGYTAATIAMAKTLWTAGGIPTYTWHWMDPSGTVEAFYSPSTTNTSTDFNLNKAFRDSTTYAAWDSTSAEFKAILRDIDSTANHLKILQDAGVAILWRPLHEAAGKWFWWGYKGAAPCKALYRLMFDRLVNYHSINNLVWVWVSDESGDALDWYPGDEYVDVVGRDYYYDPRQANHSSLVGSFENMKSIFSAKKLIALSENGSVPYPDSMVTDGANWSWFMPWYGDYTMDGWAHDNTAADWNVIMNHDYVITLDKMPGWDNYISGIRVSSLVKNAPLLTTSGRSLAITLSTSENVTVKLFNPAGQYITSLYKGNLSAGTHVFTLDKQSAGFYVVKIHGTSTNLVKRLSIQ
jgi:mannan endo-1,4-beta-mannosidase